METRYSRRTVEGDKKTEWICGCFRTVDGFFKFCKEHESILFRTIQTQIDELDMAIDKDAHGA